MTAFVSFVLIALAVCSDAWAQQNLQRGMNEIRADVNLGVQKPDGGESSSVANASATYQRFVTDRFSVGPYFYATKAAGEDAFSGVGARVDYHFGRLDRRWVPFVDFRIGPGFGEGDRNPLETQILGGVKLYMGKPGAFILIGPYYYRAFYDQAATGYSSLHAFGVNWAVGAIF